MRLLIVALMSFSLFTGAFACDKHKSKAVSKQKVQCHCQDRDKVQK